MKNLLNKGFFGHNVVRLGVLEVLNVKSSSLLEVVELKEGNYNVYGIKAVKQDFLVLKDIATKEIFFVLLKQGPVNFMQLDYVKLDRKTFLDRCAKIMLEQAKTNSLVKVPDDITFGEIDYVVSMTGSKDHQLKVYGGIPYIRFHDI